MHRISGADATAFMERLVVADLAELPVETSQLSVFTNAQGGIIDDCIVNRKADHFYVVSNAACADKDLAHVREQMRVFGKRGVKLEVVGDKALLALQGMLVARSAALLLVARRSQLAFTVSLISLRSYIRPSFSWHCRDALENRPLLIRLHDHA